MSERSSSKWIMVGAVIGLLIGGLAGFLISPRPDISGYQEQREQLETQVKTLQDRAQDLEEDLENSVSIEEYSDFEQRASALITQLQSELEDSVSAEEYAALEKQVSELELESDNQKMQLESLNETYQELILAYSSKFVISDLEVNPEEVEINQPVTITVIIENIGGLEGSYNLQLKIDDVIEASKELTIIGGESLITSFDVIKDEVKTYNFTLNGLSGTFNVIKPIWCEIGVPYEAADGLTVTLTSLTINEKTGSYQYTIWYTLKNEQPDRAIDEGSFKMYYASESGGLPQYGFFGKLFPGDAMSRT